MSFGDAVARLFSPGHVPQGYPDVLDPDERVVAVANLVDGGYLVLTPLGIWVPDEGSVRRIGWHQVTKATWDEAELLLTESVCTDAVGEVVVLSDLPPRRFSLVRPGRVPQEVRERVTKSIRTSQYVELAGGGAYFVQRKVPGRDGVVLQVRPDPGTPTDEVHRVVGTVVARLPTFASPE